MSKKGYKQTERHRRNISLGRQKRKERLGYLLSPETRKKLSLINKGKHHSEESKRKMSLSHTGRIPWNKGKQLSKEHRRKLSLRVFSDEWRRRLSLALKGRKLPKETKIKMSLLKQERKKRLGYNNSPKTRRKMKIAQNRPEVKKKISESNKIALRKPEVRRKLRKARAKQILPVKDTKIEVKIQNFLKQLGIEFFTHQYMKEIEHSYQCDILIPSMNLVIECDGIYWHKYPTGREIDHIRTKELLEKGFKVLRLWEIDINSLYLNQFKRILKIKNEENNKKRA